MISKKMLTEKANAIISAGNLTELQIAQLSAISNFTNNSKYVVANIAALPDVAANEGRLVYVVSEEDFYFSRGLDWTTVFDSSFGDARSDLYSWGLNGFGRLGTNDFSNKSSPVTVVGGITNWTQVSAGSQHGLGIANGIAYAWGDGGAGRLGDLSTFSRSSPVTVVGGITNWSQVSAGGSHSLGIAGGIAYAWGLNTTGRLGDSTTIGRSSPVTVAGGITNWSQISAGSYSSLGLADGIAYAWGNNNSGRLGDGTIIARSSPVTVVGGITNWTQVSAGNTHGLGIANGIAYAWGDNTTGRLGDNTSINTSSPVIVVGGITNWSQVSAHSSALGSHSHGLTDSGIAYSWGNASLGKLGSGSTINTSSPVTVAGGITNWSQISAGGIHGIGLTTAGIAYAWGWNRYGNVIGSASSFNAPVLIDENISNWTFVNAGEQSTFAIRTFEKGFNEP